MMKHTANLVNLTGCRGCTKICKYGNAIACPDLDFGTWESVAYGCNSIYYTPTPEDQKGVGVNQ